MFQRKNAYLLDGADYLVEVNITKHNRGFYTVLLTYRNGFVITQVKSRRAARKYARDYTMAHL